MQLRRAGGQPLRCLTAVLAQRSCRRARLSLGLSHAPRSRCRRSTRNREDLRAYVLCIRGHVRMHGAQEPHRAFREDERWRSGQFYLCASSIVRGGAETVASV